MDRRLRQRMRDIRQAHSGNWNWYCKLCKARSVRNGQPGSSTPPLRSFDEALTDYIKHEQTEVHEERQRAFMREQRLLDRVVDGLADK